jgi:hypothetical protein
LSQKIGCDCRRTLRASGQLYALSQAVRSVVM